MMDLSSAAGTDINPCRPCWCSGILILETALPAVGCGAVMLVGSVGSGSIRQSQTCCR